MRKLFSVYKLPGAVNLSLLIARIAGGGFMLTHGIPKFQKLMAGGEIQFMSFGGMSPAVSMGMAVFAEVFCAILLLLGFGTRLAALALAFTMSVAAFVAHAADPFAKKEMSLLYLCLYLILLLAGAGKYSVDYLISRKK